MKKKFSILLFSFFLLVFFSVFNINNASAQCAPGQGSFDCIYYDPNTGQCHQGSCINCTQNSDCISGGSCTAGICNPCSNSVNCGFITGCSSGTVTNCPAPTSPPGGGGGGIIRFPTDLPLRPPTGANPTTVIGNIVTFIIYVLAALGIIASIIWFLYGAIKYVTSGGDKAAIEGAKTHIISALLGLIIVLFTFVIITLVLSVFGTGGLSGIRFQLPQIF